jgi:hypothetical protein
MVDWRPLRTILAGAALGFGATLLAAIIFILCGGANIVVDGQSIGYGLMYVAMMMPFFNALVCAFAVPFAQNAIMREPQLGRAFRILALGYVAGTAVAWAANAAPFVPYYAYTQPAICYAGPVGLVVAAMMYRRARRTSVS